MVESLTLHVENSNDAIAPATESAEAWLSARQLPPEASFLVALAIEELVTNCIKYGYDDGLKHTISVVLSVADGTLTLDFVDDGHEFNPLEAPPPDLTLSIEDRPIGGLGIHLLRELTDELTYERRDSTNRVTLVKRMA